MKKEKIKTMTTKTTTNTTPKAKRGRPARTDSRFISIAQPTNQFILRATPELLERVRERASHDHRSINQTMNFLLEFALNNLDYKKL